MLEKIFSQITKPSEQDVALSYSVYFLMAFFLILSFYFNIGHVCGEPEFSHLADSFLQGKIYFVENSAFWPSPSAYSDAVFLNGHYYWSEGPFPAIILMPFVFLFKLINLLFYQGYLQFLLVILVFWLCWQISKKIGHSTIDSLFLAFAFCAASMFLGVALVSWSWYFSQVVVVSLVFSAILEYLGKKRYWLIGIIFGLLAITRITASIGVVFFVLEILFSDKHLSKEKLKKLFQLILPVILIFSFLLSYNYLRYNKFFEEGYSYMPLRADLNQARSYGLFSPIHIPGNLYYALLVPPLPVFKDQISQVLTFPFIKTNPWGMSVFITSPWLIYLFFLKYRDKISVYLIITIMAVALPIFLFYGIGYRQFGFRYALDFMPWLFFLFNRNYFQQQQKLTNGIKILILASSLFNLYLFLGFFSSY
jgi:hypothetical protein